MLLLHCQHLLLLLLLFSLLLLLLQSANVCGIRHPCADAACCRLCRCSSKDRPARRLEATAAAAAAPDTVAGASSAVAIPGRRVCCCCWCSGVVEASKSSRLAWASCKRNEVKVCFFTSSLFPSAVSPAFATLFPAVFAAVSASRAAPPAVNILGITRAPQGIPLCCRAAVNPPLLLPLPLSVLHLLPLLLVLQPRLVFLGLQLLL